jgi:Ca2+-binding RTX toxin-like protein
MLLRDCLLRSATRSSKINPAARRLPVIFHHEELERRTFLSALLSLSGAQTIGPQVETNLSVAAAPQSEMQIAVDPNDPLRVAGVTTLGNGLEVYYSKTGGAPGGWATTAMPMTFDGLPATVMGDPTIAFGADHSVYICYLKLDATTDRVVVARLVENGSGQLALPGAGAGAGIRVVEEHHGVEKPMVTTGKNPSGADWVYVAYQANYLNSPDWDVVAEGVSESDFKFSSQSFPFVGGGTPVNDRTPGVSDPSNIMPQPAVGPNGELYVIWLDNFNSVKFDRDTDGVGSGTGFGTDVTAASLPNGGLAKTLVDAAPQRGIHTIGGNALVVDRSGGAFNGRMYLAYTDKAPGFVGKGGNCDTQIKVVYSTTGGTSWSTPAVIDSAAGTTFFHATADVDQHSGALGVLYYRTVDDPATPAVERKAVVPRVALSASGAAGFDKNDISAHQSDEGSDNANATDYREYNGFALRDGTAHALWSARDNSSTDGDSATDLDAYYARMSFSSATNGNVVTISGDDGGVARSDTIELRLSAANSAYLEVLVNGTLQYAGVLATIDSIVINGVALDDTAFFNFANGNMLAGVTTTFNGGTGTDTVSASADRSMTLTNTSLNVATYGGATLSSVEAGSLTGGPGAQNLWATGFSGNVTLVGGGGDDWLRGGSGSDRLTGDGGNDTLAGGGGSDTYVFAGSSNLGSDTITEGTSVDADVIDLSGLSTGGRVNLWQITAQTFAAGILTLTLSDAAGIENAIGTPFADTLDGNARDNTLTGGNGDDHLFGNDGNDVVDGGAGNDWAYGGSGNDIVRGGVGNDLIFGDAGADFLYHADNPGDIGDGSDILYTLNDGDSIYWDSSQDTIVWL